jgi:hemin uptake protein HemP
MTDTPLIAGDAPAAEQPRASSRRLAARNKRREPAMGPAQAAPQYESEELLAGGEEALILHREEVYRLRKTWTGKLILTK